MIFGGLGKNIFNPALVGRAFLAAAYPVLITTWSEVQKNWMIFKIDTSTAANTFSCNEKYDGYRSC